MCSWRGDVTTAIYARYSSDLQSERSIDDQVEACKSYASRAGIAGPFQIYADAALSGASMATRPQLQALMADVRGRRVKAIVSEAIDRLSRDQADVHLIRRACAANHARLYTIADGEVTSMVAGLKGIIAEQFLADLAQKVRRGLHGVARDGRSTGGRCYGYDVTPGETRGLRTINEAEAAIVMRIFTEYAREGLSPLAIVKRLNAENVASPRGGPWRANTLLGDARAGDGVLCNELYRGRLIFNRRRFVKNAETGRRSSVLNPESDWQITAKPDLRIVEEKLWLAAQARRRASAQLPRPEQRRRPKRLLSGLVRCGVCGGRFAIVGEGQYGCATVRATGGCGQRRTYSAKKLDARVLAGLKRLLLDPELIGEAVRAYHEELNAQRAGDARRRALTERDLAEARRRADRIAESLIEGGANATLRQKLGEAEAAIQTLEAGLAAMAEPHVVALHPNAADLYKARVADLETALAVPEASGATREAIRALIGAVELKPEEGQPDGWAVTVHGDLAALLALANEEPPGVSTGGPASNAMRCTTAVLMGAGVRTGLFSGFYPMVA